MFADVYVVGGAWGEGEGEGGSGEEERKGVWSNIIIFYFFQLLLALQMGLKESETEGAYNECYDCFKSAE